MASSKDSSNNILFKKVKTKPIKVKLIMIDSTKVDGTIHQPHSLRLTDMLNRHTQDNPFLAITDAQIVLPNGEIMQYNFFTINRSLIVCCIPTDE